MRNRSQIALVVLVTMLVGVTAWLGLRQREPVYSGKPLTLWLRTYAPSGPSGLHSREWNEADNAVRRMGTNCIPTLLHMIRQKDSPAKLWLVAPQEALLFGGTIFENIAYGRPGAAEAEIVEAARLAYAHEFITAFPEGYRTIVGERGIKISGGQRQRVAIARAILKNPAILILDEATSSLDSESERLVQLALDRLMERRTTFIIAHRLATIRRADRILVIQDGTMVESGTHAELNRQENGLYRRLAELQFDIKS